MRQERLSAVEKTLSVLKEVLTPFVTGLQESEDTKLHSLLTNALNQCLIEYALKTKGTQIAAAEFLGISRNTLRKKICKYNITSATALR